MNIQGQLLFDVNSSSYFLGDELWKMTNKMADERYSTACI